jgi:hypothetical protein
MREEGEMDTAELLADAVGRVGEGVRRVLDGLDPAHLVARLDEEANTIAWLVWHLARVQDAQVAAAAGTEEVWSTGGWVGRLALALPATDTGYGHTAAEVAAVTADPATLAGYYDAVEAATLTYVAGLTGDDLDRVVDTRWDPPVTLGVRLVSIVADDLEHLGQAALLRGILQRR